LRLGLIFARAFDACYIEVLLFIVKLSDTF